ncbi:hypothetical protein ACFLVI_02530 [Chloroflexota bacterium]
MNELLIRLRRIWIPVVIGLFILIYATIGIRYFQQGSEQSKLREEIVRVSRIASQAAQSAQEVEDQVQIIRSIIPSADLKETDVYQIILGVAEQTGVQVVINFKSEGQKKVLNTLYKTLSFSVKVSGSYGEVREFIELLDQEPIELETLVLNKEQIKRATLVLDTINMGIGAQSAATFDFMVYAYITTG